MGQATRKWRVVLTVASVMALLRIFAKRPPRVCSFSIKQIREPRKGRGYITMAELKGITQGATATFVATPQDKNGDPITLPAGIVPTWTSSDPTGAPVTADADGLTATVTVSDAATAGSTFTLSVSAALANGTTPTGEADVPVLAVEAEVASFVITQQ
jgi:hypothetical protein